MIKAVIIDDDVITHQVINSYIERIGEIEVIESFYNPEEAMPFLDAQSVDLLFLDVEMPEMSGFSFLESVKFKGSVIIISSEQEYALKAFGYDVLDYLYKPIIFDRFYQSIKRFKENEANANAIEKTSIPDVIFVRVNRQLQKVNCHNIVSVTSNGDYLKLLLNNNTKLHVYGTLTNFQKIVSHFLIRIHRKHIVNINEINQMNESGCYVKGEYYPIGKTYIENLKSKLNIF